MVGTIFRAGKGPFWTETASFQVEAAAVSEKGLGPELEIKTWSIKALL